MSKIFARFAKDESGATAIEYGLIAALIALAIVVGAGALGKGYCNEIKRQGGIAIDLGSRFDHWLGYQTRDIVLRPETSDRLACYRALLGSAAPGRGPRLKAGMVLAIEPMVNLGSEKVEILDDRWTAVTADRKLSGHFEHSIAITDDGPEILTRVEGSH